MKSMRIFLFALVFGTIFLAACAPTKEPAAPPAHPDVSGWPDLFAADLSNAEFPAGVWTVADGVLTASEDQAIWTARDYENFTLDLEFRTAPGTNSGVIVYASDPTYEQVCTHTTGHAETVEVEYDPGKVSYAELLDVFWKCHDPTTLNRQGPDVGSQYRSAVFYVDEEQKDAAEQSKGRQEALGRHGRKIVTEITKAGPFYPAEEYHQHYLQKRGQAVCH